MKYFEQGFFDWWLLNANYYRAILFDIDGTLIAGKNMLPGSDKMIKWLRDHEFPFFLLTNDGNHSTEEKSEHMKKTGLDISASEIISCGDVLKLYVEKYSMYGAEFFVMGDLGIPCYAERAGLKVTRDLKKIDDCGGVIVGEGNYDWQSNITGVMNFFRKYPDRPLIVPNPDTYWPNGRDGEIGIGAGGKARFIASILSEMGIEITPAYLGKPYPGIYDYAIKVLCSSFNLSESIQREKILMLGDSLQSDIQGANNSGLTSVLMLTGITGMKQAEKAVKPLQPNLVFKSFI